MKKGFVLTEIVVTVAIMLILGTTSFKVVKRVTEKARAVSAKAQISQLAQVIEEVKDDTGYYPASLAALLQKDSPDSDYGARWKGPYLKESLPSDPWGNSYSYQIPEASLFDSPLSVPGEGSEQNRTFAFLCSAPGKGTLKIYNYGVTSSRVLLNGEEIVQEDEFYQGEDVSFEIAEGKVTPGETYTAEIKVLGAAISYGGSYDMPVTARVRVGDQWLEPWGNYTNPSGANLNDGQVHTYTLPSEYPAGTSIGIMARSWVRSWWSWRKYIEADSWNASQQVKVLRNGDAVPDIEAYLNQAAILEFVRNYVDFETNRIVLDANQAIYLFELGATDMGSSAADFQDLVILVSLFPEGWSEEGGSEDGGGEEIVQTIIKEVVLTGNNSLEITTDSRAGTYYYLDILGCRPTDKYFVLGSFGKDGCAGGAEMNQDILWYSHKYPNFQ